MLDCASLPHSATQRWRRRFNAHGQLIEHSNPLGETTRYQYNTLGLVGTITNPAGDSWHYLWDNTGKLTAARNPLGQHTRYRYNTDDRLTAIVWPDGSRTEYDYDAAGHCTVVKTPDGHSRQYEYNPLGLLSQQRDSSGRVTQYHYNGLSQVVKRIDPLGHTLHYHYDGERNLVGFTNENGERYRLTYDRCERLTEEIGFDGRTQRYAYNAAGHLTATDTLAADGTVLGRLRYERNARGQLLAQYHDPQRGAATLDAKPAAALARWRYDKVGRLIGADNAHRQLQWRFDAAGRLREEQQDAHVLQHRYDAAGRRIGTQLPDGEHIDYRFDVSGAFIGLRYNDHDVAAITHDAIGREIERQHGNGLRTEHHYDPQGRLQQQTLYDRDSRHGVGRPQLNTRRYHYNGTGQLSQIDDDRRGSTQYLYDPLDRLLQVQGPNPETFVHDPAGNLLGDDTQISTTRIEGNRLIFHGDTHYTYDIHGNRTEQRRGKDQKRCTRFEYDALNQLNAVDSTDHHDKGQRTAYAYDALGRRIRKQSTRAQTDFLWNGDVLLSETTTAHGDKARTTTKRYLFEPGTFKPLAFVQNEQLYHYHLDHLGTPQEISDARGKIVWAVSYRAYGSVALAHDRQIDNPLRFQGQYFDEESGLHYNRFRYYDPSVGRFINQDPIGLRGGTNNYRYVPNPASWIDPLGLTSKDCGDEGDYLYRGVSAKHPALGEAKQGIVRPANPNSTVTPEMHAEGGLTGDSPYVSWTPQKTLAEYHAEKDGPGGVLLRVPKGAPQPGDEWAWGWTHLNEWMEPEMLQTGSRTGVEVIKGK